MTPETRARFKEWAIAYPINTGKTSMAIDTKTRFWNLVDEHQIDGHRLGQILNAPIKQILFWDDTEFPEDVIARLENFLGEGKDLGLQDKLTEALASGYGVKVFDPRLPDVDGEGICDFRG